MKPTTFKRAFLRTRHLLSVMLAAASLAAQAHAAAPGITGTPSSGGVAFFPKSLDDVDGITRTVAHDIRSQYTIAYKSTNPNPNGGYRRIQVTVQAPGYRHLTARTRTGYYPGEAVR